jgi:hypothetical protein
MGRKCELPHSRFIESQCNAVWSWAVKQECIKLFCEYQGIAVPITKYGLCFLPSTFSTAGREKTPWPETKSLLLLASM